jgi:molecular chaperone DnaK (HSP70)
LALILGLDFGTSTTSVSELDALGEVRLLPIGYQGATSIPSLIAESPSGEVFFGYEAKLEFEKEPSISVQTSFKNFISHRPETEGDPNEDKLLAGFLAFVFKQVLEQSSYNVFEDESIQVRVSCPAGWNWQQRSRLLRILKNELGISISNSEVVDEPSAAGINYLDYLVQQEGEPRILVFDMGGGTLDIAVMELSEDGVTPKVLAASSEPIAGNKLDEELTKHFLLGAIEQLDSRNPSRSGNSLALAEELAGLLGLDRTDSKNLVSWVAFRVEDIKKSDLAKGFDASIPDFLAFLKLKFPAIKIERSGDFTLELTSNLFEELLENFLEPTKSLLIRVIQESQFDGKNYDNLGKEIRDRAFEMIDAVVLAGGMAHVSALRNWIDGIFNNKTLDAYVAEPEDLVAAGLAPRDVLETKFTATSNFRPNFHLVIDSTIFFYAYTPIFDISPGNYDGLYLRLNPVVKGWRPVTSFTEIKRINLLGEHIPSDDQLLFHSGNILAFERDGLTLFPDGRLVGMDGAGNQINWDIFHGRNLVEKPPISYGCNMCTNPRCPGWCSN